MLFVPFVLGCVPAIISENPLDLGILGYSPLGTSHPRCIPALLLHIMVHGYTQLNMSIYSIYLIYLNGQTRQILMIHSILTHRSSICIKAFAATNTPPVRFLATGS